MASELKIASASQHDYQLGDVLLSAKTRYIQTNNEISAALSLYFLWPKYRNAMIFVRKTNEFISCRMERDIDAAHIDLIFIHADAQVDTLVDVHSKKVRIRFEVFQICYEFCSDIVAYGHGDSSVPWAIAVSAPSMIQIFKDRRLPRCKVPPDMRTKTQLFFMIEDRAIGETSYALVVNEISMNSICVEPVASWTTGLSGHVCIDEVRYPATVSRLSSSGAVIEMRFVDGEQAGQYFDVYRRWAYPALRKRKDVDKRGLLALYLKTGYMARYTPGDEADREESTIFSTWNELDAAQHKVAADYTCVDSNGQLSGVSGLVLAFQRYGKEVWFLNQLCAVSDPNLLYESGVLYQWRSEYLAARPEPLSVVVKYWSGSRWLERIYAKFALAAEGVEQVAVETHRKLFAAASVASDGPSLVMGTMQRPIVDQPALMGGILPQHLNLATALDAIFSCWSIVGQTDLEAAAEQLVARAGLQSHFVALSVLPGTTVPVGMERHITDRMVFFEKSALVDFIAAVSHVIAVTQRRHGVGQ
jgi:hypothetical protein